MKLAAWSLALGLVATPLPGVAADSCCSVAQKPTPKVASVPVEPRFTDHRGEAIHFGDGRVWLVTFFYGSCKTACPRLLHNLSEVYDALPASDRGRVQLAAITFDPERDTTERLVTLAHEQGLDVATAHVARGDAAATRAVTKACGFTFKPDGSGGFLHANLLAVVDASGSVRNHFYGLDPDVSRVVAAAHRLLP